MTRSLNTLLTSNYAVSPSGYTGSIGFTGSAGSSSAAGSSTQIQFNNSGSLAGSADLTWSTATNTLTTTNMVLQGSVQEKVYAIPDVSNVDINPDNGTIQTWTLGANRIPTASNFTNGESVTLMITAGNFTINWSTISIVWVGGIAPALSTSGITVIELWEVGTTIYGVLVGRIG